MLCAIPLSSAPFPACPCLSASLAINLLNWRNFLVCMQRHKRRRERLRVTCMEGFEATSTLIHAKAGANLSRKFRTGLSLVCELRVMRKVKRNGGSIMHTGIANKPAWRANRPKVVGGATVDGIN